MTASTTTLEHKSRPNANKHQYLNVSFYKFFSWSVSLKEAQSIIKELIINNSLFGTVLIAPEGINGFLAGESGALKNALDEIEKEFGIAPLHPKESFSSHIPFRRQLVKIKKEIITTGRPDLRPDLYSGKRVLPEQLKHWLDVSPEDVVLLDTRNDYEVELGTFKNAIHYNIQTFKQFEPKFKEQAHKYAGKKVVMFCTGGIRCEKASAFGREVGLPDHTYQLEGGILKYLEDTGGAHYTGECFVFDGRTSVDPSLEAHTDKKYQKLFGKLDYLVENREHWSHSVLEYILKRKGVPCRVLDSHHSEYQDLRSSIASKLTPVNFVYSHGNGPIEGVLGLCEFLDELSGREVNALLPTSVVGRARARNWFSRVEQGLYAQSPQHFFPHFERHISRKTFILGGQEPSVVDVMLVSLLKHSPEGKKALSLSPNLVTWLQNVTSRISVN